MGGGAEYEGVGSIVGVSPSAPRADAAMETSSLRAKGVAVDGDFDPLSYPPHIPNAYDPLGVGIN